MVPLVVVGGPVVLEDVPVVVDEEVLEENGLVEIDVVVVEEDELVELDVVVVFGGLGGGIPEALISLVSQF